jgi:hypothetical protein
MGAPILIDGTLRAIIAWRVNQATTVTAQVNGFSGADWNFGCAR